MEHNASLHYINNQSDNGLVANQYFWFGLLTVELQLGANGLTLGNSLGRFSSMRETVQVRLDGDSSVLVEPIKQKSYILRNSRGLELV